MIANFKSETLARRSAICPADHDRLKQLPLFTDIGDDAVIALLRDATARHYPRGAEVFKQGEQADRFFIVTTGWVKGLHQEPNGHESVITVFGPGEAFAEAAMFGSGNYPFSAEIAADARLLAIPRGSVLELLGSDPDIALAMLASISRPLCGFAKQLEQLTARSATQRLAVFLKKLVAVEAGSDAFELPFDKVLIARHLGMQPETLSRALSKLRSMGVACEGHRIAAWWNSL